MGGGLTVAARVMPRRPTKFEIITSQAPVVTEGKKYISAADAWWHLAGPLAKPPGNLSRAGRERMRALGINGKRFVRGGERWYLVSDIDAAVCAALRSA